MTVIPTREESLIRAILSIQAGTVKPNAMYVNIPKAYARFKEPINPELIPVLKHLGVNVNILEHDRACFNKILPTLEFEKDPDTLIVTMDDDMTYSPLYIQGLLQGWNEFGGVVGYSGLAYPETSLKIRGKLEYFIAQGHGESVELLEDGFGTMFKLDAVQGFPYIDPLTADMDPTFYLSDDYVFCRFYDSKKITKRLVAYEHISRKGDDWSSVCVGNETARTHEIASTRNSLQDFINAGKIIDEKWGWKPIDAFRLSV
jgi:hypothetical protein